ncbi:MAG: AraC family transcriptional regulator [Candidatus Lambdaproteobacteria bacterium RIFOXYD2_FULL_50_16]|uniref:AraC family transcriptional regulator n=1 Tax=Candidatus Lambdaproteobacteria bacterium RIFOXYD2_FULL_50_16 TaxID=1817772 RepID=A0A1F6G7Q4_9PROT|nr:MAG: AraC family transcriptional regulator [Candidatus Lambdaproteobacteria bacterium RIFOXYD2_FULL_50_16]
METKPQNNLFERLERVYDYIQANLDQALSVERLAQVSGFSRFHFHRLFSLYTGLSVSAYVRQVRLQVVAHQLVFLKQRRIIEIGLDCGFENPESLARAFKAAYGQSPSQFRKSPNSQPWTEPIGRVQQVRSQNVDVKIINFPETQVAYLRHSGPPSRLNESVAQFIAWRKASGHSPVLTNQTFGLVYNDPESVEPEAFQFDICGTTEVKVEPNPWGVKNTVLPSGRCAVVRHLGSTDEINQTIWPLYRDWLPQSGEELRDFPLFFNYLTVAKEVPEKEQITDIYLPLK